METQTKIPIGRRKLAAVVRTASDIIHISDAENALNLTRTEAAKLLSRWTQQGWLRRVGSGKYVAVPLGSLESDHVLDDPWLLVPTLYAPAYIGGRTAAEHWDLTEQIFRDIVVITGQIVRLKNQIHHGAVFTLKHINEDKIFGTKTIWRSHTKITISDIHRTIIDMLDDPPLGGGIQHVSDCLNVYLNRADRDDEKLVAYADRLGNGAVFKRLGFLAERNPQGGPITELSRSRLTKGNSKLDPALTCSRLMTKWKLWVPSTWVTYGTHD